MTREDAERAIQKLCPGRGGWAATPPTDVHRYEVGVLEHRGPGPATRVVLGWSKKDWETAIERVREKLARMSEPPERRPRKKDPRELPQEEMRLPLPPPEE